MAVSVADSANPYNMVTVQERVVEQKAKGPDERIDKVAKEYLHVDKYPFHRPGETRIYS